jgi:FkbM family methyltransferase
VRAAPPRIGHGAGPWPPAARRVAGQVWHRVRATRRRWDEGRTRRRLAGPKILRAFAGAYPDAFFVEIGANDGDQHDHLRPFLDGGRWRGIMVEPVPYVFERLRANYGSRAAIALENAAIADRDGELPFYHLLEAPDRSAEGLPRWYDGIGSFSREAVLNHAALLPELEDRVVCVPVPCLTFTGLCERHGVERVDLLIVDTEGYDHQILRSIAWAVHRPRLVVYEHYHLSGEDRAQLRAMLTAHGYECKEEGFDTWCLQTEIGDALTRTFRATAPGIPPASVHEDR